MPIRLALLALLASLALAPAAIAGGPGKWTQISGPEDNIDEVSLARTADGVLHALYVVKGSSEIDHVAISPGGSAAAPNVVTSGWGIIDAVPDMATQPDGTLRAFWGGVHSTQTGDPLNDFNTATAPASGNPWSPPFGPIIKGDAAYGSDAGVALEADGTPLISFGSTGSGTFVHRGMDPNTPNFKITTPSGGCCTYQPDVAIDKSGTPFVAFFSNATGDEGLWVQQLDPGTGAPVGAPKHVPGSSTNFNGTNQAVQQLWRTEIVSRPGGGVWLASSEGYPTATKPFVWQAGTSISPIVVGKTRGGDATTAIAADPSGHLWVFWIDHSGAAPKVFARRASAKHPGLFGPAVALGSPKGMTSAYRLEGNASSGALDVVALFGDAQGQAQWHTQALAGLALKASPSKISGGKKTAVEFTVTDPDPVKGAKVSAGGHSAKTNSKGHATLDLGPTSKKSIAATASKSGYTKAKLKLKVKH